METLDTESRHHFPLQDCGAGIGVTKSVTLLGTSASLHAETARRGRSGFDSKEWIYVFTVWNTLARDKNGLEFQRLLAINVEAIETIPVIPQIIVLQCTSDSSKFKTRIESWIKMPSTETHLDGG